VFEPLDLESAALSGSDFDAVPKDLDRGINTGLSPFFGIPFELSMSGDLGRCKMRTGLLTLPVVEARASLNRGPLSASSKVADGLVAAF